eukprot:6204380-Pleurochrysis_carterae.AAC.3
MGCGSQSSVLSELLRLACALPASGWPASWNDFFASRVKASDATSDETRCLFRSRDRGLRPLDLDRNEWSTDVLLCLGFFFLADVCGCKSRRKPRSNLSAVAKCEIVYKSTILRNWMKRRLLGRLFDHMKC